MNFATKLLKNKLTSNFYLLILFLIYNVSSTLKAGYLSLQDGLSPWGNMTRPKKLSPK